MGIPSDIRFETYHPWPITKRVLSCLDSKALYLIKQPGKNFSLALAHTSDQGFHVIEITFKGAAAGSRQTVLGFRRAAFE